jgi:hypothetical protein
MAISVPKPGEVQSWFEELVSEATGCTQQMDQSEFNRHLRGVLYPQWETIRDTSGQEAENPHAGSSWTWAYERKRLQISQSVFLIQAATGFVIKDHEGGQEVDIRRQIKSYAASLAAVVPAGATTSLLFSFDPPKEVGPLIEVGCMVRGIVVSVTPAER